MESVETEIKNPNSKIPQSLKQQMYLAYGASMASLLGAFGIEHLTIGINFYYFKKVKANPFAPRPSKAPFILAITAVIASNAYLIYIYKQMKTYLPIK